MIDPTQIAALLKSLERGSIPYDVERVRDEFALFLKEFVLLPRNEQLLLRNQFGPQHGAKMLRAAQELAVLAVRNHEAENVQEGLLGVALEGIQSDFRNSVLSLCLLHHSAMKLGESPVRLFTDAASYAMPKVRDFILEYLRNGQKDLKAFRIAEDYGPTGFDYIVTG